MIPHLAFLNHRELNRKERSREELNVMCRAYDANCKPVRTFNYNDLSPAQRRAFARREPCKNYIKEK